MSEPKEGDLQFWWIPQVPMTPFNWPIANIEEGILLYKAFAQYDLFQLEHNIRPDFSNVGGVCVWEPNGEGGFDWYDYTNENGENFSEIVRK